MLRIAHGSTTSGIAESDESILEGLSDGSNEFEFPKLDAPPPPTPFTYLFDDLADEDSLILQTPDTLTNLSKLGDMMRDSTHKGKFNSPIPSIYTYFGQFVDHDITFSEVDKENGETDSELLNSDTLAPWTRQEIAAKVRNKRASLLDLDCVYGAMKGGVMLPPRRKPNRDEFHLGKVAKTQNPVKHKDEFNDVPRGPKNPDAKQDRAALIADPRNDSHVIISQMHVAFLRAHNAIVHQEKCSFEEARRILQMHYQWIIIKEFLPTVVSQEAIDNADKGPAYDPSKGLPLEFAVGAYRFGHSMVRNKYYLNDNFGRLRLPALFTLTVLSNAGHPTPNKGYDTLPDESVIQWRKFLDVQHNAAREIRPKMVEPLFEILNEANIKVPGESRLSVLDLKRSYMMRIPTGQAIAERLGLTPLTATEIESCFPDANDSEFLRNTTLSSRTPLFLYVLAEAALNKEGKLGPVGGRLVAKVLTGVVKSHKYSFLNNDQWSPHVGKTKGQFYLADLLQLAGVLEP